jgi:predicted RNA-binding protein (virulence factor B family)
MQIGKYNRLRIVKEVEFGLYLDGGEKGEILLPRRYVPEAFEIGEELDVFVYLDSENRPVATTQKPYATVGDFACLTVAWVNQYGAFLNWGLMKDLLVPFREQKMKMQEGNSYPVYVYWDELSQRIVASAKLDKFITDEKPEYRPSEEVDLLITQKTDLGYKAIVNNRHVGMLYHNQVFRPLTVGDRTKGYIKEVRPDGKIDLRLEPEGYGKIDPLAQQVLSALEKSGGRLPLSDKSSAEEIARQFGCSKKSYKQAIGVLFKERKIRIDAESISLISGD